MTRTSPLVISRFEHIIRFATKWGLIKFSAIGSTRRALRKCSSSIEHLPVRDGGFVQPIIAFGFTSFPLFLPPPPSTARIMPRLHVCSAAGAAPHAAPTCFSCVACSAYVAYSAADGFPCTAYLLRRRRRRRSPCWSASAAGRRWWRRGWENVDVQHSKYYFNIFKLLFQHFWNICSTFFEILFQHVLVKCLMDHLGLGGLYIWVA